MRRSNSAPTFDTYWADSIVQIQRALTTSNGHSYCSATTDAVSLSLEGNSSTTAAPQGCTGDAATATQRAACLRFGERLAQSGSFTNALLGTKLQRQLHLAIGNDELASDMRRKHEDLQRLIDLQMSPDVMTVLVWDEAVMRHYVERLQAHGEVDAIRFIVAETVRLRGEAGYSPCQSGGSQHGLLLSVFAANGTAVVRIKRNHRLGQDEVRQRVDRLAGDLKSQFGVDSKWAGDRLKVSGSGIDGHLVVADDSVELDVRLGFALKLMESSIRDAVEQAMDKHLV